MDLDSFLTELYVTIDDGRPVSRSRRARPGRPPRLSPSEVLPLAVVAQWPRWRSERDFWRYAQAQLRPLFPHLGCQSQFNRRVRALEPELRHLQRALAARLAGGLYRVLDTSLTPAVHRVRACRHGLFAGQATFGWCASKTDWVYGFKVALVVTPAGVITTFGLALAASDERRVGEALIAADGFDCYLADKGFTSASWEQHWRQVHGAEVLVSPQRTSRRAWSAADYRWAAGKRQIVEQVFGQLKDFFALDHHRAKTLSGLLGRLAAKIAAFTAAQWLNARHDRPLRHFADLLL